MATFRSRGGSTARGNDGRTMVERGYDRDFAQRCFDQIRVRRKLWLSRKSARQVSRISMSRAGSAKCPAAFAAALLTQPSGFYAPAQIVRDALEHDVEVREADVNHSDWDCTLEGDALRLGLRQIDGLQHEGRGGRLSRCPTLPNPSRSCVDADKCQFTRSSVSLQPMHSGHVSIGAACGIRAPSETACQTCRYSFMRDPRRFRKQPAQPRHAVGDMW